MASGLAGDQWNEGDVSCSVVRRVVLPDSCFTIDGLYETTFSVLHDFGVYPGVVRSEIDRYLRSWLRQRCSCTGSAAEWVAKPHIGSSRSTPCQRH